MRYALECTPAVPLPVSRVESVKAVLLAVPLSNKLDGIDAHVIWLKLIS